MFNLWEGSLLHYKEMKMSLDALYVKTYNGIGNVWLLYVTYKEVTISVLAFLIQLAPRQGAHTAVFGTRYNWHLAKTLTQQYLVRDTIGTSPRRSHSSIWYEIQLAPRQGAHTAVFGTRYNWHLAKALAQQYLVRVTTPIHRHIYSYIR